MGQKFIQAGGWILDLISRCWLFAMSAIIFSAIACTLLTASASGVALGYNYSMAEFIQLKETNVSVYLKRGVFNDELDEEISFRRKAERQPNIEDDLEAENERYRGEEHRRNKRRAMPEPVRTLDDSIIESSFIGNSKRLRARPPDLAAPTTVLDSLVTPEHFITENVMGSDLKQYIIDGKSIQGLINRIKLDSTTSTPFIPLARPPPTPDPFFIHKKYKNVPDSLLITGSEDPRVGDALRLEMLGLEELVLADPKSDVDILRKPTPAPDIYDYRRSTRPTTEKIEASTKPENASDYESQKSQESDDSNTEYGDDEIKGYSSLNRSSKRSDRRSETIHTEANSHTHRKDPSRNVTNTASAVKERNKRNDDLNDKFEAIFGPLKKHILIRNQDTQVELTDPYIVTSTILAPGSKPVEGILNTMNVKNYEPSSNEDLILKLIKSSMS